METLKLLKQSFVQVLCTKSAKLKCTQKAMTPNCCISFSQYSDLEHGIRLPAFQEFVNIKIYDNFISTLINNVNHRYKVLNKSGVILCKI